MFPPTEGRDDPTALLVEELNQMLTRDWIDGINLLTSQRDGWVELYIMAFDLGTLGTLLATLNDPGELEEPSSLSRRMTSGDSCAAKEPNLFRGNLGEYRDRYWWR
jgi:hypothetical protein